MGYLYKNYADGLCDFAVLDSGRPACSLALPAACAKPAFSLELSVKPTILASWRPRRPADGPPGAQDSRRASWRARRLPTGLLAPQTASGWASWRPRRPSDRPPGAQVGLWTSLLTPQMASDGPSPADKFTCRQDHLPTSPPADKSALAPSEPSTPTLFWRSRRRQTNLAACRLCCMSTCLRRIMRRVHTSTLEFTEPWLPRSIA